jgi:hypothetical protein
MLWALAGAGATSGLAGAPPPGPNCDAAFKVSGGHGGDQILIPTGWKNDGGYSDVLVEENALIPQMGARAYFADTCTAGKYNNTDYMRANLLGKTLRFSTDLTGAGCGCNAAFYLTSMGHNSHVSDCFDYYCDANNVCGQSCAEIDLMEANQHAWHSTLHTKTDSDGAASGFGGGGSGWNGPRNWTEKEYGIGGSCIDTAKPFDVAVAFPIDRHGVLVAMQVSLSQKGQKCKLQARVDNYASGMKELTHALLEGMTPIVSYWADDDMLWMDGLGEDNQGPCQKDSAEKCADAVKFFDFSIEDLDDKEEEALEEAAHEQDTDMAKKYGDSKSSGDSGNEWWHPDDVDGSEEWDSKSSGDSGNEWWHPDDVDGKGGGEEGGEGGNEWWHPDAVEGSDKWESEAVVAEEVLMQRNEVFSGHLRGTAEADGPRIVPYIGAALFAGAVVFAAVAVTLRRRAAAAPIVAGESGAEPTVSSDSLGGSSPALRRLRGSFGSLGSLGGQDAAGGRSPMPMLQQPPSTQNLLMGSPETQAP